MGWLLGRKKAEGVADKAREARGNVGIAENEAELAEQRLQSFDPDTDPIHVGNEGMKSGLVLAGYALLYVGILITKGLITDEFDPNRDTIVSQYCTSVLSLGYLGFCGKGIWKNLTNFWTAKAA